MKDAPADLSIIGKLFARTPLGSELRIPQWEQTITDIVGLANSANALMCIMATEGCGKTTFLQLLQVHAGKSMDALLIVPASPSTQSGWLLEAMTPWLSSSGDSPCTAKSQLATLAETSRPILICIDVGTAILDEHLSGDIAAMLNLADSCHLRLSVLVCCGEDKSDVLAADKVVAARIIYRKALAAFSDDQLHEFLTEKIRQMGIKSQDLRRVTRDTIVRDAGGSPGALLKVFAEALGHNSQRIENLPSISSQQPAKRAQSASDPLRPATSQMSHKGDHSKDHNKDHSKDHNKDHNKDHKKIRLEDLLAPNKT
jgi:hypothetical protein